MSAASSVRLGLPRSRRIKQRRDFLRAKTEGKRAAQGCLIANWRILPDGSLTRLGVITSKAIGIAVARNRARRLLREAFRLNQSKLAKPMDLVLVARNSIMGKNFAEVEIDLLKALERARLLKGIE